MPTKLSQAFKMTEEQNSGAFERFANGFLVDDYPDLISKGGKKDNGIDAFVYDDASSKIKLVVQSCISPPSRASTKVLDTIRKLNRINSLPEILVYCTSHHIGTALDETKLELRRDFRVNLEICDAGWFVTRCQTSNNRLMRSETYARETLAPFVCALEPNRLYSLVLEETQQRVAVQYLEAVNLDRSRDGNLTKGIFDGLIACVTRDSVSPTKAYTEDAIVTAICGMFPEGHTARIREIVPGRIQHLVNKNALHHNTAAGGFVLSHKFREKVQRNIQEAKDNELTFLAALGASITQSAEELEVDYQFSTKWLVDIGHQTVLWYLREQGKVIGDSTEALLNIQNAEKLIGEFLEKHPLKKLGGEFLEKHPSEKLGGKTSRLQEYVMDLLPRALFRTLNSRDEEVRKYLRSKADLFLIHGFLQVTPDVQDACKRLLGNDVLYLDTNILIYCLAEYYSPADRRQLLNTLSAARQLGYQLRTWQPYIDELTNHLKSRVHLEWINNYRDKPSAELAALLPTARTLIRVFCDRARTDGNTLPDIIDEIIGQTNQQENAIEFLRETFGIKTELLPSFDSEDQALRDETYEEWFRIKRRFENISAERFKNLVDNDVNSYVSIIRLRRTMTSDGPNYGHKFWYLSLDRTPWKIASHMSKHANHMYEVAMSLSYLINCVATLAMIGQAKIPQELIPATAILEESELVPSEIRAVFEKQINPNEKPYLRERKLRDLSHQLKSSLPIDSMWIGTQVEARLED